MNNITTSISFSIFSSKGLYALLLGAGISKVAGVPTGWDVVLHLIAKLANLNSEECTPTPEQWFKNKYGSEPNYSNILAKLFKTPLERVNYLRTYFEPTDDDIEAGLKKPSLAHQKIANLVKKGYIRVIITTNFDRLIENALKDEGIEPIVISHPNDIEGAIPLVHNSFVLIKINGDYLDTRFLNTEDELSSYDPKLYDYIQRIINEFGLITCGWSAKWDIGLVNILKKCENFRFYSYWTYFRNCETELLGLANQRKGETVMIEGADSFFNEIHEKIIALETINDNHPLTSDIAIARLKKYIVKDEYKIQLHDLIFNQQEESFQKIISKANLSLKPNSDNLLPLLNYYFNTLENLLRLVIIGVFWSKKEHYYLFLKSISRFSEPILNPSGRYQEATRYFHYFPSLLLLYSIGISTIKTKKYDLLLACFNLKIWNVNITINDQKFLIDRINSDLVEKDIMNDVISKNYNLPVSQYIYQKIEPFFRDLHNSKEFEECFDIFEYLLSLNFISKIGNRYGQIWAPKGLYYYKLFRTVGNYNYIEDFLNEAYLNKSNWEPIKAGMFDGKYEVFIKCKEILDTFLKSI